MTIVDGSEKKQSLLLQLSLGLVFICCYVYFKTHDLWTRYRWAGLAFGAAWTVILLLSSRKNEQWGLGLRVGLVFLFLGVITLVSFLRGSGDTADGLFATIWLGFAARELYLHYKGRKHSEERPAAS